MLEHWTQRKKRLDQCHQYVLFENTAKSVLDCISENGESYLATHAGSGRNRAENEQLQHEQNDFKGTPKVTHSQRVGISLNERTFRCFWH